MSAKSARKSAASASTKLTDVRCPSGVEGLDDVLAGGLPSGCFYLVQGDPGSGKPSETFPRGAGPRNLNRRTKSRSDRNGHLAPAIAQGLTNLRKNQRCARTSLAVSFPPRSHLYSSRQRDWIEFQGFLASCLASFINVIKCEPA